MEGLNPTEAWAALLGGASALLLLSNAAEKIVKAWKAAKAPNDHQNERLDRLEKWQEGVNQRLDNDYKRLDDIDEGNRATQRALLALLDHGIDGNNIDQMQHAKESLQNHLINR
jgi:hypothetical protein